MRNLINPENLHHAYLLVGDISNIKTELVSFLEKSLKIKTSGNPDFWQCKFNVFSVDDARALSSSQDLKDFNGEKKIFIIQTNSITEQAQNSLLKVFEEPTSGTHFFLILPQDTLLPTLRSRMHHLNMSRTRLDIDGSVLEKSLLERMKMVKEISDGIKDESKTKQDATNLLNQIQRELYENGIENKTKSLQICADAEKALHDNGAPVKMILENVMLSV